MLNNIYIPYVDRYHEVFTRPTTIGLACVHAVLVSMMAWCYLRMRLTNPGEIPRPHNLTLKELHALEAGDMSISLLSLPELSAKEFSVCESNGAIKFCRTCQIYRPIRATHCHETGRCIVKLDHYCPALSSAIGVGNYKYFINFLFYTVLLTIYLQIVSFLAYFRLDKSGWILTISVLSSVIGFMGVVPFFILHLTYIRDNVTTREDTTEILGMQKVERSLLTVRCRVRANWQKYGILPAASLRDSIVLVGLDYKMKPWKRDTIWENWSSVMGVHCWEWILPIAPTRNYNKNWWEFDFNESTKAYLRKVAGDRLRLEGAELQELEAKMADPNLGLPELQIQIPEKAVEKL